MQVPSPATVILNDRGESKDRHFPPSQSARKWVPHVSMLRLGKAQISTPKFFPAHGAFAENYRSPEHNETEVVLASPAAQVLVREICTMRKKITAAVHERIHRQIRILQQQNPPRIL